MENQKQEGKIRNKNGKLETEIKKIVTMKIRNKIRNNENQK